MCSEIRGVLRGIPPHVGGSGGTPDGVGVRGRVFSFPYDPTPAFDGSPLEVNYFLSITI